MAWGVPTDRHEMAGDRYREIGRSVGRRLGRRGYDENLSVKIIQRPPARSEAALCALARIAELW